MSILLLLRALSEIKRNIYIHRPPPGFPITPPNTYLLLKRTIYGIKRSPKYWCDKATKAFVSLSLVLFPNTPCLFTGIILPGYLALYVGLYVGNFLYFSSNPLVEAAFEQRLKHDINMGVDFNSNPQQFLGLRMECSRDDDSHVVFYLKKPPLTFSSSPTILTPPMSLHLPHASPVF